MIVVSDTSVITNLVDIGHLYLLGSLYQEVVIPRAVYEELTASEVDRVRQNDYPWIRADNTIKQEEVIAFQGLTRLDRGESAAILLAQRLNADLLLIDERLGRTEAQRLGIRITGLLGILLEAKQNRLIDAVKPLIDKLIDESAFRVSPSLYELILAKAKES